MHNIFKLYSKISTKISTLTLLKKLSHYLNVQVAQRENPDLEIWSVESVLSSETSVRSFIKREERPGTSQNVLRVKITVGP